MVAPCGGSHQVPAPTTALGRTGSQVHSYAVAEGRRLIQVYAMPLPSRARAGHPPAEPAHPKAPALVPAVAPVATGGEDEALLVAAARAGDRSAFAALFDRYQTPIVNYLFRVV